VEMLCAEFEVLKKDHGIGIGELERKEWVRNRGTPNGIGKDQHRKRAFDEDVQDLRENVEAGMQDPKKKAELQPLRKTIDRTYSYLEKTDSNEELISLK
jgi:hypothetical protein